MLLRAHLVKDEGWRGQRVSGRGCVLVSCGCHKKSPQTWWLKITDTYSLPVLQARSSTSSLSVRPCFLQKVSGRVPSLPFQPLQAVSIPVAAALHSLPLSTCGLLSVWLSFDIMSLSLIQGQHILILHSCLLPNNIVYGYITFSSFIHHIAWTHLHFLR